MIKLRSRLVSLALAGLMAGQAVLPVWAAEAKEVVDTGAATENIDAAEAAEASEEDTVGTEAVVTPAEDEETTEQDSAAAESAQETETTESTAQDTENTAPEDAAANEAMVHAAEDEVMVLAAEDEVTAAGETDAVAVTEVGADGWPIGGIPGSTGGVLFPQNSDGTVTINGQRHNVGTRAHRTIDTVDSTALGVRMYMFRHPISEDYYSKYFYDTALDPDSRTRLADTGVQNVVGEDGYPIFANGESTRSLFDPDSDTYQATQVNHLFSQQIYEDTGYLSYNSMDNYAYLNPSTGDFRVYEDIGVPWWGYAVKEDGSLRYDASLLEYKFQGQFFPYDDLTDYVEPNIRQIANSDASPMSTTDRGYGRALYRATGYTFHYGMMLETDFVQPIDGMVTGSGRAENMRYEFTGDDIIWVFLDGVLVLVPAQIYTHGAGVGSIDFATGEVTMGTWTTTIRQMFGQAGMEDAVEWNGDTFADYSEHTMQMFYAETGEDAARLQVRFNLVTIPDYQADKHVYDAAGQQIDGKAIEVGDVLTYTVTAENPALVTKDVVITDTLPEGVEFVSAENNGSYADGKVTWQLSLAAGAKRTVSCKVRVTAAAMGRTLVNTALEQVGQIAIRTNEVSNPVNERYRITTEAEHGTISEPVSNILRGSAQTVSYKAEGGYLLDSVTVDGKAVDPATYENSYTFANITEDHIIKAVYTAVVDPTKAVADKDGKDMTYQHFSDGDEVVYSITVTNPSGLSHDITVTDDVPASLSIEQVSDDGRVKDQRVTWTLQNVAAHESRTVTITAKAIGTYDLQTVENQALMNIAGYQRNTNKVVTYIKAKERPRDNGGNSGGSDGGSGGGSDETQVITKVVTETVKTEVPVAVPAIVPVVEPAVETTAPADTTSAQDTAINASAPTGGANITTGDDSQMLVYAGIAALSALLLAGWAVYRRRSLLS